MQAELLYPSYRQVSPHNIYCLQPRGRNVAWQLRSSNFPPANSKYTRGMPVLPHLSHASQCRYAAAVADLPPIHGIFAAVQLRFDHSASGPSHRHSPLFAAPLHCQAKGNGAVQALRFGSYNELVRAADDMEAVTGKQIRPCCNSVCKLKDRGDECLAAGDSEMAFIYFWRVVSITMTLQMSPEYLKNQVCILYSGGYCCEL